MKKNIVSSKTKTRTTKKTVAAKTATPNQGFVISAAKATRIRKDVVNLGLSFNQLLETVTKGKKDMDAAKETINNTLDSMSEMENLRLQMAMDRLSKMMSTLSNLLKKISDTSSAITQNIK